MQTKFAVRLLIYAYTVNIKSKPFIAETNVFLDTDFKTADPKAEKGIV